ncbi:MAG: SCO family protein [Fimbriimonas sp.]
MNKSFAVRLLGTLIATAVTGLALAQAPTPQPIGNPATRDVTRQMGLTQRLGAPMPLDLKFTTDKGEEIRFRDLVGKRPLLLMPVFYRCKSACILEMDALVKALVKTKRTGAAKRDLVSGPLYFEPGQDFDVVFVSIHPKETWELARASKARMMDIYSSPDSDRGWHYLVGSTDSIKKITDAVGFKFSYDEQRDLINHPVAGMFVTLDGRVSSYIANGVNFPTKILMSGAERASRNEIGQKTDSYLFGCIMMDPATGQRSFVINNIVRLAAVLTLISVVGSIFYMSRKYRQDPLANRGRTPSR